MAGRPPHTPTEETRAAVDALSAFAGLPAKQIADYIGVSTPTLLKHYKDILTKAKASRLVKVGQVLFQKAMEGNIPACMFIMKCQGQWKETGDRVYESYDEQDDGSINKIRLEVIKPGDKNNNE